MNAENLKKYIKSEEFKELVKKLYSDDLDSFLLTQRKRYEKILDKAITLYGDGDYHFISSPGRTEIGGNHTDHQRGVVIAASINLDNLCIVKKSDNMSSSFCDKIFGMNEVDLDDLSIHEEEKNNTKSVIRGIAARVNALKYKIGGFRAFQDMNVLVGSGLSSSACFEVLMAEIFNSLYNEEKISDVERAQIAMWAENNYFGKPCGLMDQMACSVGSFVNIDFKDSNNPIIKKLDFNFEDYGYDLLILNVKASHADLTNEYSAMPNEMKMVASYFGKEVLSEVDENIFFDSIDGIRKKIQNDRAVMRAIHFFNENARAKNMAIAIGKKDIDSVLSIMSESGNSSYMYLQNVYAASYPFNQAVSIALAMSKKILASDGICRVHGGGFAGTIQVVVKKDKVDYYINQISKIYGEDAVLRVKVRPCGTRVVI